MKSRGRNSCLLSVFTRSLAAAGRWLATCSSACLSPSSFRSYRSIIRWALILFCYAVRPVCTLSVKKLAHCVRYTVVVISSHLSSFAGLCPQVEGLEEYLNDPVKQHHLVRALPARMRRQLLYKRWLSLSLLPSLSHVITVILTWVFMVSSYQEIHLLISREPAEVGLHGSAAVWSCGEVQGERPGTQKPHQVKSATKTPHRKKRSSSVDCCWSPHKTQNFILLLSVIINYTSVMRSNRQISS